MGCSYFVLLLKAHCNNSRRNFRRRLDYYTIEVVVCCGMMDFVYLSALKVCSSEAVATEGSNNAQQNDDAQECSCETLDLSEGQATETRVPP